jgi:hypothetical protein
MKRAPTASAALRLAILAFLLLGSSLACSVGEALVGRGGAQPTPTKTPRPTFTPRPGAASLATRTPLVRGTLPPGVSLARPTEPGASAAAQTVAGTEGVTGSTNIVIYATETPKAASPAAPLPTATPGTDTETNRPTRQAGPRLLPTPYVVVRPATLNGRRGPGTAWEKIGKAKSGDELIILGKSEDEAWWQVCCLANQPAWVIASEVEARGPLASVPMLAAPPTPVPPAPAAPAVVDPVLQVTAAPPGTPMPPFDIARGPEFPIQRDNNILTIWAKVYEGQPPYERPIPGYILKVFRDGVDVSDNVKSFADRPFDKTGPNEGLYEYNLKFEIRDAGEANWRIYLARPGGIPVSPPTEFSTLGDSYRNLVAYVAYLLAR